MYSFLLLLLNILRVRGLKQIMSSRSGYLPNIAQNFGYYKNLAINSLQRKEFDGARSALMNLEHIT